MSNDIQNHTIDDEEEIHIDFADALRFASGVDQNGHANSAAVMAIQEITAVTEVKDFQSVLFGGAVLNFYASGGCTVAEVDFPMDNQFEARRATQVAAEWLANMNTEEYANKFFSLTVVPFPLGGQISLVFFDLVYFTSYKIENGQRLILCFDNASTKAYEMNINLEELKTLVSNELLMEERALDDEAAAIRDETRRLKEESQYDELIRKRFLDVNVDNASEFEDDEAQILESDMKPGFRAGHSDN